MVRGIVISRSRFPMVSSRRSYTIQLEGQPDKVEITYPKDMADFKIGDKVELNFKGARDDGQ